MKLHYALIALAATSLDCTAANKNELQQSYIRKRNGAEAHHRAGFIAKVSLVPWFIINADLSQMGYCHHSTGRCPVSHLPHLFCHHSSIAPVPSDPEIH